MEIDESLISNKSYTDKDFATIYPELLDLVKKLTNKWDPSQSVESDPGVVLLKLASILADKNNYNIDKNVLETFPQTVTQLPNARRIYDMLGYSMHWYKSAVVKLQFTYVGGDWNFSNSGALTINKWTQITNDSGDVNFVTLQPCSLNTRGVAVQDIQAMEGILHTYEVNGVNIITLDNLDAENRIFFTENNVAQNGIFVFDADTNGEPNLDSSDAWQAVDNLEALQLHQKAFKFGVLPNTNSCYIQFPYDIGTLIGNGLVIKYITSTGEAGNVSRGVLTSFASDYTVEQTVNNKQESITINSDTLIKNNSVAYGGAYPEEVSSAYKNYKKTIGTFDTLVTTLDYHNAIYRLTDSNGQYISSNNVVSDRTDDLYWSEEVIKLTEDGDKTFLISDDGFNAFNIGLYVLYPFRDVMDVEGVAYNRSFSVDTIYQSTIQNSLDNKKCVCHDYFDTSKGKPPISSDKDINAYLFKNFYTLRGKLTTYYKVTDTQAQEIEDNVKLALYRTFNAHEVEFGKPIDYDSIVETIKNADTRIKSVILGEPEYELRILKSSDSSGDYGSSGDPFDETYRSLMQDILRKMVTSGHVQLYNFNRDITFRFGQTNLKKYTNVQSIETSANITLSTDKQNPTTLGKNQTVIFCAPNLVTETQYSSFVNVKPSFELKPNVYYQLGDGKTVTVSYTDTNGTAQNKTINDNIVLYQGGTDAISMDTTESLGTNATLSVLKPNSKTIVDEYSPQLFCIFFTNDYVTDKGVTTYYLFRKNSDKRLLGENEYFIYTDSNKNELVILGSGTLLTRSKNTNDISNSFNTKESEIIANGLSAIEDDGWYVYNYATQGELTITEMQIVSMGEGTQITASEEYGKATSYDPDVTYYTRSGDGTEADPYIYTEANPQPTRPEDITTGDYYYKFELSNKLLPLPNSTTITYTTADGESGSLQQYDTTNPDDPDLHWYVKSSVNMAVSGKVSQEFSDDNQLIINGEDEVSINGKSILANYILAYSGGNTINTSDLGNGALNIYTFDQAELPKVYANDYSDTTHTPSSTDEADEELKYESEEITISFQKVCGTDNSGDRSPVESMEFKISPDSLNSGFPPNTKFILPIRLLGSQTIVSIYQNNALIQLLCGDYIQPFSKGYAFISSGQTYYTRSGGGIESDPHVYTKVEQPSSSDHENYYIKSNTATVICAFTDVVVNFVAKDSSDDLKQIYDKVILGQIRLYDDDPINIKAYSDQFYTTASSITDNVASLVSKIENTDFDTTYIVPDIDAIDTTTSPTEVQNNLFMGNAVWDINHILNKYTIPQLNTKNSTIKVSASSLQKNV